MPQASSAFVQQGGCIVHWAITNENVILYQHSISMLMCHAQMMFCPDAKALDGLIETPEGVSCMQVL